MTVEPTVSLGDIAVIAGLVLAGVGNYFATVGVAKSVDYKVEELRRGRGLILRDWPVKVQRCFGYINGKSQSQSHSDD